MAKRCLDPKKSSNKLPEDYLKDLKDLYDDKRSRFASSRLFPNKENETHFETSTGPFEMCPFHFQLTSCTP